MDTTNGTAEELVFKAFDGKDYIENLASVTAPAKHLAKSFGKDPQLFYNVLSLAMLTSLRTYCDGLDIQYYKKRGHNSEIETPCLTAP